MSNPDTGTLPTLRFSDWLNAIGESDRSGTGMAVACGECRGCCTSSYFIPVGPDETDTLAAIPKRLLFRAPGMPKGHFLIGYAENGHCALFRDNACSVYANRPRACRAYDCRVFPATGLSEEGKPAIARQAERWRFAFPSDQDKRLFQAVRDAARFLREKADRFPAGFVPVNPTQQAGLALRIYQVFLGEQSGVEATLLAILDGVRRKGKPGNARQTTPKPASKPVPKADPKMSRKMAPKMAKRPPKPKSRPRRGKPG